MKIDGRLQGSSLPGLWNFGEWVTGSGKIYHVTKIDPLKHTLMIEPDGMGDHHSIGNRCLKLICRITLLPLIIGWLAKASYRSRYELERKRISQVDIPPVYTPPNTPNESQSLSEPPPPLLPSPPKREDDTTPATPSKPKAFSTSMGNWTSVLDPERFCYPPLGQPFLYGNEALTNEMERALNQIQDLPANTRFILFQHDHRNRAPFRLKELQSIIEENKRKGKQSALLFLCEENKIAQQIHNTDTNDDINPLVPWRFHLKIQKDRTGMNRPDVFIGVEEMKGTYFPTFIDEKGGTSEVQIR